MDEKLEYIRDKEPEMEIRKTWKKNWNIYGKPETEIRKNLEEELEYLRDNNPETEITKDLEEKLEYLREKELQRWRSEKTWKKNWNIYGIRNQRSK